MILPIYQFTMWWCVFVCCLAAVFGDVSKNATSAIAVKSNFAIKKDLIVHLLSEKNAFKKKENSLFDAFCIKDVLEKQVIQKFRVADVPYYRINLFILGGLGDEDIIGECRDRKVFIRQMKVALLLAAPNDNPELWTSSFTLNDVRITKLEANAMTAWLNSEPNHVQKLIQEEKLKLDEAPPKDFFHVLARHFPEAPWSLKYSLPNASDPPSQFYEALLKMNTDLLKMNTDLLQVHTSLLQSNQELLQLNENRLSGNTPPSQVENPLPRRNDLLRRRKNSKEKTIAKSSAK